jgi:hypothetical protein
MIKNAYRDTIAAVLKRDLARKRSLLRLTGDPTQIQKFSLSRDTDGYENFESETEEVRSSSIMDFLVSDSELESEVVFFSCSVIVFWSELQSDAT